MNTITKLVNNELKNFDLEKLKILDEFWSDVQQNKKDISSKWGKRFVSLSGPCIKVDIINGRVSYESNHLKDKIKPERLGNTLNFLSKCCSSIKRIKSLYINLSDTGTEFNDYPILTYSKCKNSSNILIPDPFFLNNYDTWHRMIADTSINEELKLAMSSNSNFGDKKNMYICRIKHNKFKSLDDITKNIPYVDVKQGYNHDKQYWVSLKDQLHYKYLVTHPNRWDTTYKYFKSNSLVLMFTTNKNEYTWENKVSIWLTLFLTPYEHYLPFSDRKEFMECIDFCEKNQKAVTKMIIRSSEIADAFYTKEKVMGFGCLLLKKIEEKKKKL